MAKSKPTNGERLGCSFCRHEVNHKTLGAKLRAKREATGIAQSEVARVMKVHPSFVCDLEHGKRNWTPQIMERYLAAVKRAA